jgi:tetratricopeptide (TPR) repeat protein
MGGLGKTTLAVRVAHRLTERYPDGQIVVDMGATSGALSPAQALARVIHAFEPLMQLPDAVTGLRPIYLSVLRGKRVLLLLDDALDGDQVAPLVPPEDCALVSLGKVRRAIEFHEQSLSMAREIGDRRAESSSLGNLGLAYEALGQPRQAIEFFDRQLVITRQIGVRRGFCAARSRPGLCASSANAAARSNFYIVP